ncbi:hypothetical protein LZ009_15600 [Ramlibacter sp. XY19]|uniref:hypothetical protein n=1 Tax=Ramlibacter paludis TaxID=2908000 RepID=UPI0023DB9660|nr:hypothetical protein [Ramlibacter paludis]MCG2594207.1 hypothetical protein [Ramlibacter paludis]
MNHADIDPSLCTGERTLESLDDGFSPPAPLHPDEEAKPAAAPEQDISLGSKSPF